MVSLKNHLEKNEVETMSKFLSRAFETGLCVSLTFTTLTTSAFAGAWTAPKGAVYSKSAVNYFTSTERFGDALPSFERFRDVNFTYYTEVGLQDNLTLFGAVAVKDLRNTADGVTTDNFGVGDVDIGLRYNFFNEPFVFSAQGLFKAPFLYDEDADLPLGNGQIDVEGRLLVGKSLGALGYVGAEAGYRFRADAPVDEFRYLVEYGFDLTSDLYLRTKLDGTLGLGDIDEFDLELANAANPSLPLAFDLGKLEYTAGYKLTKTWAVEVTGTTNIYGDNTLRGTNIQFAIVGQF